MPTSYNNLSGATVGASKVESIQQHNVVSNRYRIHHLVGRAGTGYRYGDKTTVIDIATVDDKGKTVPGIQPEQLVLIIRDFLSHQTEVNQAQIDACNQFLEATSK